MSAFSYHHLQRLAVAGLEDDSTRCFKCGGKRISESLFLTIDMIVISVRQFVP